MVGGRVCSHRPDGLDGNLLRRRGLANSHCYSNSNGDGDGNSNGAASDGNANGYCNSNSDRNAYADANINPMYGEVFTDAEASTNSGASPVGRNDQKVVICDQYAQSFRERKAGQAGYTTER